MIDESSIGLELSFTRSAHSDSTAEFLEVSPHAHESRQHVFELCKLDLHLRFGRSRARGEDVENQLGAIHHAFPCCILDVLSLSGSELVIEHDERCLRIGDSLRQFLDFAFAKLGRRIGSIDLLRQLSNNYAARRIDELGKLIQMLGHHLTTRRTRAPTGCKAVAIVAA